MKRYIVDYYPPSVAAVGWASREPTDIENYLNSGPFPGYVVATVDGSQIIWRLDIAAYTHLGGRVDVADDVVTIYKQDNVTVATRFRFEQPFPGRFRAIEELAI